MVSEWENGKSTQLFSRSAQSSQQTFQNWKKKRKKCRHLWCLSSPCSVVQPWYVVPFHLTAGYGQLLRRREITSFHFLSTREIKKEQHGGGCKFCRPCRQLIGQRGRNRGGQVCVGIFCFFWVWPPNIRRMTGVIDMIRRPCRISINMGVQLV